MSTDPNSEAEQPWYLRRRALIAAAFLMVVAAIGGYLAVSPSHRPAAAGAAGSTQDSPPATPPLQPGGQPPPVTGPQPPLLADSAPVAQPTGNLPPSAPGPGGGCGLPAGSQAVPVAGPTATWAMVGTVATPASPAFGPAKTTGGIGNCFAHDPTGALFAAVNTMALTNLPPSRVDPVQVLRQRAAASGPGYPQALAAAQQAQASSGGMPADPSTAPKVAFLGFEYVDYTPVRAVIQIAVGLGDPLQTASYRPVLTSVVMLWQAGDWRYLYPAGAPVTGPIINADQYIAWSA